MKLAYAPDYFADIGPHVMPIRKFGLVADAIAATGLPARFVTPEAVSDEALLRVHTEAYVRAVATGQPRALAESQKFPWSPALARAVRLTNGGTVLALRCALADGIAGNLASGFHHAHAGHGEGFCTFNGLVVAMEALRTEGLLERALVVDLDLHYGNGTASLLASRPWAHQLSIYGCYYEANRDYPDVTERRAPDTENAVSIPVPAGATGEMYLELIAAALGPAIDRARPDVVLYQAGADPYREDPYSRLDLGRDDLYERDALVFRICRERGLPVMWVLAGGYTADISKIVTIHTGTFRAGSAA